MKSAHDAEDAIMAYREEVGKAINAYREEVGEIIQEIPRQIFARLVDLTPNAREAVLLAICNGRTFSRSWRTAPTVEESNLNAKVDWPRAYIEELEAVLAGSGARPARSA
jgi:hypothetical protein